MSRYRPFTDGHMPDFMYFDTSFLVLAAASHITPEREEAAEFLERLLAHGTFVVTSMLVLLEAWHVFLRQASKEQLKAQGEKWKQEVHDAPAYRKPVVPKAQEAMDRIGEILSNFIDQGRGQVVGLAPEDIENAIQCIGTCGLDSYDAAHAGVMMSYDIRHIATRDGHFAEVSGFILWLPPDRYRELI